MGRSPKTEGASGRIVNSQDRGGTSPGGVRFPVPTRRKAPVKSVWGIDTTSKYQPIRKPPAYPPLAPSVTCGDSSLPEGAMGCIPFHIGLCLWKVPAVQSLSHASGVPAPFDKGAFGCAIDTGRVWEVKRIAKSRRAHCQRALPAVYGLFPSPSIRWSWATKASGVGF